MSGTRAFVRGISVSFVIPSLISSSSSIGFGLFGLFDLLFFLSSIGVANFIFSTFVENDAMCLNYQII